MRQYKLCIQIIIIIIIFKKIIKVKCDGRSDERGERWGGERIFYLFLFSLLLFQIYENQTVDFF